MLDKLNNVYIIVLKKQALGKVWNTDETWASWTNTFKPTGGEADIS